MPFLKSMGSIVLLEEQMVRESKGFYPKVNTSVGIVFLGWS